MDTFLIQTVLLNVFYLILTLYVIFFAVHAAQHIANPIDRAGWLLVILVFNVVGATVYLLTKYRKFYAIGKGKWMFGKKTGYFPAKEFFYLSDAERETEDKHE